MSPRLLILCPDRLGEHMSGMGIRYTEIASALAHEGIDVTLAGRETVGHAPSGVEWVTWAPDGVGALRALVNRADAVLTPPGAPHVMRVLRHSGVRVAIDLYDPEPLEVLERFRSASKAVRRLHATTASDRVRDAFATGHFFVCASERQRDLWIGTMLAHGHLGPAVYDHDPSLRSVLDLLPFGVPASPPAPVEVDPIRSRFPVVASTDRVLLWNGGLWRWLDAPTAIRAVARVRESGTQVRLVFMGASSAGGAREALAQARSVATELGLVDDAVLFNDSWVGYGERAGWLLHADAALSTHSDHLETRFAFRTRLLDCFWAGLPPVVTTGDALAQEIRAFGLGATAPPGDVEGLATAIQEVLQRGRDSYAEPLRLAAERHEWPTVVRPLSSFLRGEVGLTHGLGGRTHLNDPPALHARRLGQRVTRRLRVLRERFR